MSQNLPPYLTSRSRSTFRGCLLLIALLASTLHAQDMVELARGGESTYTIVVQDKDDSGRIMKAASVLREILQASSGAELPITQESAWAEGRPAIYLGKTIAAKKAGIPVEKVSGWAYLNRTVGQSIYLVGDVSSFGIEGEVGGYNGALKAVTAFLESQLDVSFLLPGDYGRRIPPHEPLTVAADMDDFHEPLFTYVIGRAPKDETFAASLNLFRRQAVVKSYGGHSYYDAVPRKKYAKTHPEYFAETGGVRATNADHLCISNPEVQELMLEEMERQLDRGYQWVELSQTDGYRPCNCAQCVALHPFPSERLWIVHRKLAEEMQKRRPGKKVMIISYQQTRNPPESFDSFPDNVVIQLTHATPEQFDAFEPFHVDKSVYIYNWAPRGGVFPTISARQAIDQVKRFVDRDVLGIYLCGGYFENRNGYGLNGPSMYAFGKALENPDIKPEAVLNDYVNRLFGKAAGPMRQFYRTMYDRIEGVGMETPEDQYCQCFPPRLINDLTLTLARAKELAEDEKVKAALRMVELEFDQVKRVAIVYHIYRAYRAEPTRESFAILARQMASYRQWMNSDDYPTKLPGGLPLVPATAMKETQVAGRPPFNWDFEQLMSKSVLPGVATHKRMDVPKGVSITVDGECGDPAWQNVPWQPMSGISMAEVADATRFKLAYDDEALFLAVECEFNSTDWMQFLKSTSRDGAAWAQECIELCIDPWGNRDRHYQLVFSPVQNATYDSRRGYFGDRIDPMYGKTNVEWNGDWTYGFHLDEAGKRWTGEARIPYRTLEVDPPEHGTLWTFNIGRSQWPKGYGNGAIYSTWAPNLEGDNFHDRSSFGELIFK